MKLAWANVVSILLAVTAQVRSESRVVLHGWGELRAGEDFWPFPASGVGEASHLSVRTPMGYGCSTLSQFPPLPGAHVQLISRGSCTFQEKIDAAAGVGEGVKAILIFNQGDGEDRKGVVSDVYFEDNRDVPVFFLSHAAGLLVFDHGGDVSVIHTATNECFKPPPLPEVVREYLPIVIADLDYNRTRGTRKKKMFQDSDTLQFLSAAGSGLVGLVRALLYEEAVDVDARHPDTNETALHLASAAGRVDVIRHLVRAGASLEATDSRGWTPLVTALKADFQVATLMLLQLGASVSSGGHPPLWHACLQNPAPCDMVLQYGADPNYQSTALYQSVLHVAASRNAVRQVEVLLRWGADPTIRSRCGLGSLPSELTTSPEIKQLLSQHATSNPES
ncbi:26S proteasome non-ATPase regulatory subunit 10 [Diplonema papillatum]|nr:26S proteasome non-ATPase regulatory subunit 10 [Diplonema papillatum]